MKKRTKKPLQIARRPHADLAMRERRRKQNNYIALAGAASNGSLAEATRIAQTRCRNGAPSKYRLENRTAEANAAPGGCGAGHKNAINQALSQSKSATKAVQSRCGGYAAKAAGAAAALAAAAAAIAGASEFAAPLLAL